MLVGAVLAPEQREHGEFEVVGLTPEQLNDALVLAVGRAGGAVQRAASTMDRVFTAILVGGGPAQAPPLPPVVVKPDPAAVPVG